MAYTSVVKITHDELPTRHPVLRDTSSPREQIAALGDWLAAIEEGTENGSVACCIGEADGVAATATITISSGSGAVNAWINGRLVTVTWATSDANTATLLSAAINASVDPNIVGYVTSSPSTNTVVLTASKTDATGDLITLAVSGTGVTATGTALSGARAAAASGTLTMASSSGSVGGTIGGTLVTVTWATSDAASSTALAAAINANTTVNKWVSASAVGAVTTITALEKSAIGNNITLVASGTNVTASGAKLTGGRSYSFTSYQRG